MTMPSRTALFGDLALEAADDSEPRYRTVRFFELSEDDSGDRVINTSDGKERRGRFVSSHYLSKLVKFSGTEGREDGFLLRQGERRIAWSEWPEIEIWLKEMNR